MTHDNENNITIDLQRRDNDDTCNTIVTDENIKELTYTKPNDKPQTKNLIHQQNPR
jgi:hypothetical protein